jgi:hypothetical protein
LPPVGKTNAVLLFIALFSNFDILAAVFGDVVKFMHDDLSLLSSSMDEEEKD